MLPVAVTHPDAQVSTIFNELEACFGHAAVVSVPHSALIYNRAWCVSCILLDQCHFYFLFVTIKNRQRGSIKLQSPEVAGYCQLDRICEVSEVLMNRRKTTGKILRGGVRLRFQERRRETENWKFWKTEKFGKSTRSPDFLSALYMLSATRAWEKP